MHGLDPGNPHSMEGFPQVCYLKNVVDAPNIEIGDYTYYDDSTGPERMRFSPDQVEALNRIAWWN